jgi:hypothetical protein
VSVTGPILEVQPRTSQDCDVSSSAGNLQPLGHDDTFPQCPEKDPGSLVQSHKRELITRVGLQITGGGGPYRAMRAMLAERANLRGVHSLSRSPAASDWDSVHCAVSRSPCRITRTFNRTFNSPEEYEIELNSYYGESINFAPPRPTWGFEDGRKTREWPRMTWGGKMKSLRAPRLCDA